MTKIICVNCQTEFSSALGDIGVVVVEMAYQPPVPYNIWMADLLKCPGCGVEIVGAFGNRPIASGEAAARRLAEIQRLGQARVIYDYERPVEQTP